jgi:hypothetical protein
MGGMGKLGLLNFGPLYYWHFLTQVFQGWHLSTLLAASMRLNIHFIHPLVESQDERPLASSNTTDNDISHGAALAFDPFPDDFLSQFTFDEDHRMLIMP